MVVHLALTHTVHLREIGPFRPYTSNPSHVRFIHPNELLLPYHPMLASTVFFHANFSMNYRSFMALGELCQRSPLTALERGGCPFGFRRLTSDHATRIRSLTDHSGLANHKSPGHANTNGWSIGHDGADQRTRGQVFGFAVSVRPRVCVCTL